MRNFDERFAQHDRSMRRMTRAVIAVWVGAAALSLGLIALSVLAAWRIGEYFGVW